MTDGNDGDGGRKTEREATDDDAQGRQEQREEGRDGWTPDAETPKRKGDVTPGEPSDADAGPDGGDGTDDPPQGSVPEGGTDARDDFQPPLDTLEYPLTTNELRKTYRQYRVETDAGATALPELLDPADGETFGSPAEVRERIEELADRA